MALEWAGIILVLWPAGAVDAVIEIDPFDRMGSLLLIPPAAVLGTAWCIRGPGAAVCGWAEIM